jgi:GR25 family glycosyltransferase involved in LPS biosynthesis
MNYFDKITCINLIERDDKYEKAKNIFKKLNIDVEFYRPKKHINSGRVGCFESHVNVIEKCYNSNYKNIFIFEDDAINTPSFNNNTLKEITGFLTKNEWCEYFQFGYTILPHETIPYLTSKKLMGNNIIKYNGNCTHAYCLNRNGMERILKTWKNAVYKKKMDLDIYYKEIFKNNGACTCPILFDQDFCIETDNDPAISSYYIFMRKLSCIQFDFSFLYWLSIIKFYENYLILFIIILLIFIVLFVNRVYLLKKIKKYKVKRS